MSQTPSNPDDPTRHWDGQPVHAPVAAVPVKSGNVFGRHKVLSAVGAIILVLVIIGIAFAAGTNKTPVAGISPSSTPSVPSSRTAAAVLAITAAPSVSETSTPTPSPTPTLVAKPVTFTGRGDKVLRLSGALGNTPEIVTLSTSGQAKFIVDTLDETGADTNHLVNATGHFAGTVPLDLDGATTTSALKIQADGNWAVTIQPVASAPRWSGAAALTGKGDAVFIVIDAIDKSGLFGDAAGRPLNSVTITHDGQAHFIVNAVGGSQNHLINAIGHYSDLQVLPPDTVLLVVQADGAWTVAKLS